MARVAIAVSIVRLECQRRFGGSGSAIAVPHIDQRLAHVYVNCPVNRCALARSQSGRERVIVEFPLLSIVIDDPESVNCAKWTGLPVIAALPLAVSPGWRGPGFASKAVWRLNRELPRRRYSRLLISCVFSMRCAALPH